MADTDEQIIRDALKRLYESDDFAVDSDRQAYNDSASAALDHIMSRTLPELAEGWFYTAMYQTDVIDPKRDGWRIEIGKGERRSTGEGQTPRDAALTAIAEIRQP
jgi:hypothetical protein